MTVADAQSFLKNLQQSQQGQGVVTVHEKSAIDSLVNNIQPPAPVKKQDNAGKKDKDKEKDNKEKKDDKAKTDSTKNEQTSKPDSAKAEGERVRVEHHKPEVDENAPVDTRKKVMESADVMSMASEYRCTEVVARAMQSKRLSRWAIS